MFTIDPVTGTLGANIGGIDLAEEQPEEVIAALSDALVTYKVLFFRDQHELDDARQVAFARRFGPIQIHPFLPSPPGTPEISIISTPAQVTRSSPTDRYDTNWHSDVTFHPTPPLGSILRAVEIPDHGRDTMWCDMEAAYRFLSPVMQALLAPLRARHDWRHTFRGAARALTQRGEGSGAVIDDKMREYESEGDGAVHPVIRTHPVSGRKAIFVNGSFTEEIVGMRADESRLLLDFLRGQTRIPEFQVRFRWAPGSVAFWDNRSVQHYIINDHDFARVMHRVTIEGDAPR